jgi:tetratricopeptide (TPR) repeat protein
MENTRATAPFLSTRAAREAAVPTLILLSLSLLGGCSGEAQLDPTEADAARDRAAARAQAGDWERARTELAPLVARRDARHEDLLRAAAVEFASSRVEQASALLERAEAAQAGSAAVHFLRGQIAYEAGDAKAALEHFSAAHLAAPEDLPSRLMLGAVLNELDRLDEARGHFTAIVDAGIETGGQWYVSALYRQIRLLFEVGEETEAQAMNERWMALQELGVKAPAQTDLRLGSLGRVRAPLPAGSLTAPAERVSFETVSLDLPLFAGALEVAAHDLDGDGQVELVARLADGVAVARRSEGRWTERRVLAADDVRWVRPADLDNDGDLELAVPTGILTLRESGWVLAAFTTGGEQGAGHMTAPSLPGPVLDAVWLDFDHEGDLDLLLVGAFGARVWRNDGAWVAGGALTDASTEAQALPGTGAWSWCATEDLDGDNDVDLVIGGAQGIFLADNRRGGRFSDASHRLGGAASLTHRPLLADLDADGRVDLLASGPEPILWLQTPAGGFEARPAALPAAATRDALDLDLDGALDLVWDGGALLAAGLPQERAVSFEGWPEIEGEARALCFADLDGDAVPDALRVDSDGVYLMLQRGNEARGLRIALTGKKDNARGTGAVIELRSGPIYRRVYHRGEPLTLGLGKRGELDVLRIHWPNGVVQTDVARDLSTPSGAGTGEADTLVFEQIEGLVGSCPFLYTWNGETYEFVSDVLGITPLGLPMAPGVLVPPDHDEYVLVRGDQLRPVDGELRLQFTEELREVTYLDRVRLECVDHPSGSEVFPDERFTFPPFPEPHTHVLRDPLPPTRAVGSDGKDWTAALARTDDVHAVAFERQPPQFQGLAKPWWLELSFDPDRTLEAEKLRLVLTGWFYWSNSSVNMASARHPGVDFVPPILQIPDGEGGWKDAGGPVGFPAGKTKTMILDLTDLEGFAADPRLRIFCTLQLFWDRIVLAVDGDDEPLVTTHLEPISTVLWPRGFSVPLPQASPQVPERFLWERLAERPRWNPHPGHYTRYGDCLELVTAIDDRFVILGAGDALAIAFDASSLPELREGYVRDYLVFLDGWAKDRDPNSVEAERVEPLPFHGMSGYPYGPGEAFPDDEFHRAYREQWLTRPARRLITPISPLLMNQAAAALR